MSSKIIVAAAAVLIGSTAIASAQTRASPLPHYYWNNGYYNGYSYYNGPAVTFGVGPGFYAPGYYDYAPGYDCRVTGCNWNDGNWNDRWGD
jgi:hypothetical protein